MGASTIFVIGTDIDEGVRLPIAREMGFIPLNAQQQDIAAEIEKVTGKKQVDVAVECSGAAAAVQSALSLVRKGGSVTLLGIYPKTNEVFFTQLVRNEININTSYTCTWNNYEQALQLVASGQLDLKPLMACYPFEQGLQAIEDGLSKKVIKPVLVIS